MRIPTAMWSWSYCLLVGYVLMLTTGCNRSKILSTPTARQLRAVTAVYLDYAAARGHGPQNEQQLLAHIKNVPPFLLTKSGLTPSATEHALVSKRDGEPLVIRYGVCICLKKHSSRVIVCEKTGKNGTRYMAFADGHVACLDDDAAKELMQAQPMAQSRSDEPPINTLSWR